MSPMLKVRISAGLDAAIGRAAQRGETSKGEWVRGALERTLAEESVSGDPLTRLERLKGPTGDIEQILDEIDSARD